MHYDNNVEDMLTLNQKEKIIKELEKGNKSNIFHEIFNCKNERRDGLVNPSLCGNCQYIFKPSARLFGLYRCKAMDYVEQQMKKISQ